MTLLLEDPSLLRRFREGDRTALEVVYRHFVRDVWTLLRLGFVTGDAGARVPGIADRSALSDAVQEVFVRAFGERARLGYDGLRPYRPYLLRIARNVRIDQLRTAGREVLLDDPSAAASPEPAEDREDHELQAEARAYVETLDAETRRFVQLRFVEELAQAQVAEHMAVSRRRVRTLEARVLDGLRRVLRKKKNG